MKNRLLNLLKLIVGIGLLYWLFHKLQDPGLLWQQIIHANLGLLLLGACCYAAWLFIGNMALPIYQPIILPASLVQLAMLLLRLACPSPHHASKAHRRAN